jgi:Golgi nucleoside diphosphatase
MSRKTRPSETLIEAERLFDEGLASLTARCESGFMSATKVEPTIWSETLEPNRQTKNKQPISQSSKAWARNNISAGSGFVQR